MTDFLKFKPRFAPTARDDVTPRAGDVLDSCDDESVSDDSVTYFFERPLHPRVSELIEESRAEQEVVRRVSDADVCSAEHYMQLLWARASASRVDDVTVLQASGDTCASAKDDDDVSAYLVDDVVFSSHNADASISDSTTAPDQFKTARCDVTSVQPKDDDQDTLSDVENLSDDGDVTSGPEDADDVIWLSDSCCGALED